VRRRAIIVIGVGLALLVPSAARAQLEPLSAPKGTLRFDIRGMFESAASRYLDGTKQEWLADFGSPALGADHFSGVRTADSLLAVILGTSQYRLNLGRTTAVGQMTVGTGTIGINLGVTSRLTLFANFPLVSTRVEAKISVDSSTGLAGLNPAHPRFGVNSGADQFFTDFAAALDTLFARASRGVYSGADLAAANALVTRGNQVRQALDILTRDPISASPFLPTDTSAAGRALVDTILGMQSTLTQRFQINQFDELPILATSPLTTTEYQQLIVDPGGPYAGFPLAESRIDRLGDMDVGAVYTLVDRWDRPGRKGSLRLAFSGLLRLPTGTRDNPDNFLDVGTGNGRYEVGLGATGDVGHGRLGLRATGGVLLRLPSRRVRRVAPLSEPIAPAINLANLELDAGDEVTVSLRPFYRLSRSLAVHFAADWWRRGDDKVSYFSPGDSVAGVAASVMGNGTGGRGLALGGGLSYVGRAARECTPGHKCGFPIDASWTWTTVATASGGRVSKSRITRIEIRWYQRLWR
jgi:hypothetical protein